MADLRTFYRKLPHENVWHFCRECENWPQFGYGERDDTDSRSVTFCARCIEHHRTSHANGFTWNCPRVRCLCEAPEKRPRCLKL
jgi:hypothetical protein